MREKTKIGKSKIPRFTFYLLNFTKSFIEIYLFTKNNCLMFVHYFHVFLLVPREVAEH